MSAPTISQNFSGIIIDQNHSPRTALAITDTSTYYQTFHLPEDLQRESFFPSLSGFQVLLGVSASEPSVVEFDYVLEQYLFGSGWSPIIAGTSKGAPVGGDHVWIDVLFDHEVTVSASQVPSEFRDEAPTEFRIALSFKNKVTKLWYVTPNPYSHGEALHEATPLKGSLNFRLLALVADQGTDFLGNPYRSVAIISESSSAGANPNAGYWLSSPQPSPFAVVSHYSDLRPFPTTPKYGTVNRILDPNFEYDRVGVSKAHEKEEEELRTKWKKEEEEAKITKKQREEKEAAQTAAYEKRNYPALWEPIGGTTLRVNRWRGEWSELETYEEGEGVRVLSGETFKTFVAIKSSRAISPLTKEGESFWEERAGQFETIKGIQYLEVQALANKRGVRLKKTTGEVPVKIGIPSTFSFWIRCEGSSFEVDITFGNKTVGEETTKVTVTSTWTRHEVTLTPTESGLTTAEIAVKASHIFFLDVVQVNNGLKAAKYIDGDVVNCFWNGSKGSSSSVELTEKKAEENAVVIDSVLIDPITPGVGMNVYYSNDLRGSESEEPTIEQWEKKLWTRVPQTYVTSGKTTFVFPEPVTAKFVKVEFTNLQAKPYDPGDFQNPIRFKKFPDWVSEVFLSLQSSPEFVVGNVGVVFDKLELMYNYYTKDLVQSPTAPATKISPSGPATDVADPATLSQIQQIVNTFTKPPALLADSHTLLGSHQQSAALKQENYPVEANAAFNGPANFPVSSLDRSNIVLDQNTPVMFFFVTCRHEYKELTGKFAEKKAYFAGLKQLAFMRHTYTTTFDGDLYIESGSDDINTDRNDFDVKEGIWFTN